MLINDNQYLSPIESIKTEKSKAQYKVTQKKVVTMKETKN